MTALAQTMSTLEEMVAKEKYVSVGKGVNEELGVRMSTLRLAISQLRTEKGYTVHYLRADNSEEISTNLVKVLAGPGVSYREVFENRHEIVKKARNQV